MADLTDELGYIAGLIRTRGDANVPLASLSSYLETQYNQALRDDDDDRGRDAIREAWELLREDEWELAREVLVAEIARRR